MTTETTAAPPVEAAPDAATPAGIYDRLGRIEGALPHLATKADIGELRADGERLRADMAQLQVDLQADIADLRANDERLRADLERQLRLMTWTIAGVMLAGLTVLAALLRLWG